MWYKALKSLGTPIVPDVPSTNYPKIGMLLSHVQDTREMYPSLCSALIIQDQKAAYIYINDIISKDNIKLKHARVKKTKDTEVLSRIKTLFGLSTQDAETYLKLDPSLGELHDIL